MVRRQALRSLANFFDATTNTWRIPWKGKQDFIEVGVDATSGYRQRTIRNATDSDITLSVARDPNSTGERLTRASVQRAGKPHVELKHLSDTFDADVAATVARLNQAAEAKGGPIVINTAGNGLSTLRANQDVADIYAMRLMDAVLKSPDRRFEVAQVRSGGQTGYDIAFIKAALANDIPVKIHAARGRGGGFLVRRRNNRDAELGLEEYLDELEVNGESIQKLIDKMRTGVQEAVAPQTVRRIDLDEPIPTKAIDPNDSKQVFVFGSNLKGVHGAGAAKTAKAQWGAQDGVGFGPTGRAYAIPTKRTPTRDTRQMEVYEVENYIEEFFDYAKANPDLDFMFTPVGTGLGGYELDELATIIARHAYRDGVPNNVYFVDVSKKATDRFIAAIARARGKVKESFRRIDLDEPTIADVDEQRKLLAARGRDQPKDALEAAITEEQARTLNLSETQRRQIDAEKGEIKSATRDVERLRRSAIERVRKGKGGGEGMQYVTLDDIARHAPELLDNRPTFDMDLQMDRQFLEGAREMYSEFIAGFRHNSLPASEMPTSLRFSLDGIQDIIRNAFASSTKRSKQDLKLLEEYTGREDLSHYGPAELRMFIERLWRSPDIDQAVKDSLRVTDYYSSVLKADNAFPVVQVTTRASGSRLTAEGVQEGVEVTRMQRVVDLSKFDGASPEEIAWLETDGSRMLSVLLQVISGDFYGGREKQAMLRVARRYRNNLRRKRKETSWSDASEAIDDYFRYFENKANNANSKYRILSPDVSSEPVATRFQEVKTTTPRIERTLRGADGKPIQVSFQWDNFDSQIINSNIFVNGELVKGNRGLEILENLFEIDASYTSLIGDTKKLNPYHRFELAYRKPTGAATDNLLGRRLSSDGIKFNDGESLLDKFVLDTLGYRADPRKRTVQEIILEAMADLKVEKKRGKEIRTWIPKKNQRLNHFVTGKPASAYAREYRQLVEQAMDPSLGGVHADNYENLVRLSEILGRRQLSSSWDVNFWGNELTPAHALTRIMHHQGLRNPRPTRRIKANKVEEVEPEVKVFRSKEDMPPEGPMTDDEIWYAYRPGEVREMSRETIENVTGIRRTLLDEDDFLTEQQIYRPFRNRIVTRQPQGRQPRPPKPLDEDGFPITRTPSQKAGRILPRTDEEKALLRAKMTDEYGFEVLMFGDEVVDIMRKPGSNRHFGNPYHIDDAANIVQRVHANTKFEYYLLNGSRIEAYSPGLDKMIVYDHASYMRRNLWRLRGKKLSCVCGSRYCHGEVLLQYAESADIGRLIDRFGDNPALLSQHVEDALLRHGRATRTDFESYLSRYERQFADQLTTLPTEVNYRVQTDDLFIERVMPRFEAKEAPITTTLKPASEPPRVSWTLGAVQRYPHAARPATGPKVSMPMYFKDGTRGLRMSPENRGKSTMDLIIEGKRTGTTRASLNQFKGTDGKTLRAGDVVEFTDNAGRTVQVEITKAPYRLPVSDDPAEMARYAQRWSELEGWDPAMYSRYAGQYQMQYRLIK